MMEGETIKIIKSLGNEYNVQKDGDQFKVTRTIQKYDKVEDALNAMRQLVSKQKTEEEISEKK
jgi:hypothetical protein